MFPGKVCSLYATTHALHAVFKKHTISSNDFPAHCFQNCIIFLVPQDLQKQSILKKSGGKVLMLPKAPGIESWEINNSVEIQDILFF